LPDILLIQPPIRDFYLTKKRTIPYGLATIAASLLQHGFSVEILDGLATKKSGVVSLPEAMNYLREYYIRPDRSPFSLFYEYRHYGYSYEHIGAVAGRSGAFLVGISSLFTPYAGEALAVAEVVKRKLPGCKVVLGGHHPTALPGDVLHHTAVDFVIRGEGEHSLPLLAKAIREGEPLFDIPGLCYVDHSRLVVNEPVLLKQPEQFPLPALNLIKLDFYQRKKAGSMVVMAGRGCPFRCSYCSVGHHSYLTYRRRPVVDVLQEIGQAVNKGVRFIDFEDENLSLNRNWFLELLGRLSAEYAGYDLELRAMNGLLPTTLDEAVIQAMQHAGFKELNLALCTTSPALLKRFCRPDVRHAFEQSLFWAEKYGLSAVGYIIIGSPWQTSDASLNDLIYLINKRVLAGLSVFYPSPGSADYEFCKQNNLLPRTNALARATALPISHFPSNIEGRNSHFVTIGENSQLHKVAAKYE
jgi:radical SAM superfamily enzyme YgiQ (UPF0313 family)